MSQIASFTLLEISELGALRAVAAPTGGFPGGDLDEYHAFLEKVGCEVAEFRWDGIVMVTLLSYLQERRQIDLLKSEHDDLSMFLCSERDASVYFLTQEHKRLYLERLQTPLASEQELADYFNTFHEANETEIGKALLDGIATIRECLRAVDERSVVLLSIG